MMDLDGISLELMRSRLQSVVDEAGATLVRTAHAHIIREVKDFAIALADARGRPVVSTQTIPVFLGTIPTTIKRFLEHFPLDSMGAGDVMITNDPWLGAGHLTDVNILMPLYDGEGVVGFVIVVAHMADIGGAVNLSPHSHELFEEGLRIPMMKLVDAGNRNQTLIALVAANVRVPTEVVGDLDAMMAAARVVSGRAAVILQTLAPNALNDLNDELYRRGEAAMRLAIHQLRSGSYIDSLEIEGVDVPVTLVVRCDVDADTSTIIIDFEGTSGQVRSAINCTHSYTLSYALYLLKCLLVPHLPLVQGMFLPITVRTPERSVLNCSYPAAVGARNLVGQSSTALLMRALAGAIPENAIAECGAPRPFIIMTGQRLDGNPFSVPMPVMGGFGGRPMSDGPSALPFPTNTEAMSVEVFEASAPLLIEEKELVCDSGGAGRYRGGLGQRIRLRALIDGIQVSIASQKTRIPPVGLFGGLPGACARVAFRRHGGEDSDDHGVQILRQGDEVIVESPGGGGYGEPRSREPHLVARDVAGGYVSEVQAREIYGLEVGAGHKSRLSPRMGVTAGDPVAMKASDG